jgi:hypothetical protein
MRAFRAAGLDVVAAPSPVLPAGTTRPWRRVLPDTAALALSELCLHEYVGVLYYMLRGWS